MVQSITVRWRSWDGMGLEHLILKQETTGITADSLLIGDGDNRIALTYRIECDREWRVRRLTIRRLDDERSLEILSDGAGRWADAQGTPLPHLDGAVDIDISGTPFTNTLPIRRLKLAAGESAEISVAYIRLPELSVALAPQRYTCLQPGSRYRYESRDSGFQREIETDGDGLVTLYPDLFRRV